MQLAMKIKELGIDVGRKQYRLLRGPQRRGEVHKEIEESLSLEDREKELIQKALVKHKGKRKYAAAELGISERTLYRKIKEYNLAD